MSKGQSLKVWVVLSTCNEVEKLPSMVDALLGLEIPALAPAAAPPASFEFRVSSRDGELETGNSKLGTRLQESGQEPLRLSPSLDKLGAFDTLSLSRSGSLVVSLSSHALMTSRFEMRRCPH